MAKTLVVTADTDNFIPGKCTIEGVQLCAAAANAIVEVFDGTVATGTSVAKIACVANESAPPLDCDIDIINGVSIDITGAGAKAFITYE